MAVKLKKLDGLQQATAEFVASLVTIANTVEPGLDFELESFLQFARAKDGSWQFGAVVKSPVVGGVGADLETGAAGERRKAAELWLRIKLRRAAV